MTTLYPQAVLTSKQDCTIVLNLCSHCLFAGALVMPFAILLEMTNQYWLFGHDWYVYFLFNLIFGVL